LRIDPELETYRNLMTPPGEFEDGFTWKSVIAAFFVAFLMLPGSIYLFLMAGQGMGAAAQWVTVILFAEVARRSFTQLKRQEIYIILYMAGALIGGGAFGGLIRNQYLVRSEYAQIFQLTFPKWVCPPPDSPAILHRTFLHKDWLPAIGVILITTVLSKLSWFTGGYILFRITSDVEKLPYPLAPVNAMGATALAETGSARESWRWRMFSIGAMIGIVFGAIYIGMPGITNVVFGKPVTILPIPWLDLTQRTASILPATPTGITFDLGALILGMVLPFWSVMGGFAAAVLTLILNPILYKKGFLVSWRPDMDAIATGMANSVDFWLSFTAGIAGAVFVFGIVNIILQLRTSARERHERELRHEKPKAPVNRGDIPIALAALIFIGTTIATILVCKWLVPNFPVKYFIFFGFVYTPLISYVNARLLGLAGQTISIPYLRQATFILSGYKGTAIWFAPIPLANHAGTAQFFREMELIGTRFTSIIKAELLIFPLGLLSSFIFWSAIWKMGPIPSSAYPYAQKIWPFEAFQQLLWVASTTTGGGAKILLEEAIKWKVIAAGFITGIGSMTVMTILGLPILLIYGFVRGLSWWPHFIFVEFIGALIKKYYFMKRFGEEWLKFAPVLMAGFACGMGLISMAVISVVLISKSVIQLPY